MYIYFGIFSSVYLYLYLAFLPLWLGTISFLCFSSYISKNSISQVKTGERMSEANLCLRLLPQICWWTGFTSTLTWYFVVCYQSLRSASSACETGSKDHFLDGLPSELSCFQTTGSVFGAEPDHGSAGDDAAAGSGLFRGPEGDGGQRRTGSGCHFNLLHQE